MTCGPDQTVLKKVLSLVKSITTDNGVEINVLRIPNVLDAFYRWMDGEELLGLRPYIDGNARLFPNAIRIIGIGHTVGGMIYAVCNSHPDWPRMNEEIRALVHFFRNKSYRKHIQRCLKGRCNTKPLDTF